MRIDVWSDILCPFCHLGRRHLALALEEFEHADEVDVIWHSFQLDRTAPPVVEGRHIEHIAAKYGAPVEQMVAQHTQMAAAAAEVGLDFAWERIVGGNSYDAHRLLHFARSKGMEEAVTDRVMRAWYSEGAAIGDRTVLADLAAGVGLDRAEVEGLLESDDFGREVREDLAIAHEIGVSSVPTFVLDQKYGVVGAQPVEVLVQALREVWEDRATPPTERESGCGGDCCAGACETAEAPAAAT